MLGVDLSVCPMIHIICLAICMLWCCVIAFFGGVVYTGFIVNHLPHKLGL